MCLREAQQEADRLLGADGMRERRVRLKEALVALDAMYLYVTIMMNHVLHCDL